MPTEMNNQAAQTMPEPEDWQKIHVLMAVMEFRPLTDVERKEMHEDLVSIREAALSQTAGVVEPARYFASGPQGHFFADDLQLARDLVNLYDKDDDWTITDLRNPTGAAPTASGGEDWLNRLVNVVGAVEAKNTGASAMYLARMAHESNAGSLEFSMRGVSADGEDIGDWIVTVQKSEPAIPSTTHPDALQDGTRSKSTAKRVEALAASGGEDECDCMGTGQVYSHGEGWFTCAYCKGTGKAIEEPQPPSAASVSERARELRERAEAHGGGVFVSVGDIRVIEQALTQQRACATCGGRGEIGGHVGQTAETFDYVTEPCPECTTPQPSADAVREVPDGMEELRDLAPRALELAERLVMSGPKAAHVSASETHEIADFVRDTVAMLSAASDHQHNAAQGGGEK